MHPTSPGQTHEADYVKLFHSTPLGCFQMVVGNVTVNLSARELLLPGAAIDQWWREHPEQVQQLKPFM